MCRQPDWQNVDDQRANNSLLPLGEVTSDLGTPSGGKNFPGGRENKAGQKKKSCVTGENMGGRLVLWM